MKMNGVNPELIPPMGLEGLNQQEAKIKLKYTLQAKARWNPYRLCLLYIERAALVQSIHINLNKKTF